MSSSSAFSLLRLLLLTTGLCLLALATTTEAAKSVRAPPSSSMSRQADPSTATIPAGNTSLALANPTSGPTASEILMPAMRTLVGGPLRLLRQLAAELIAFLRAHRLPMHLYDMRFWQSVAVTLPSRASTYWSTLVSMESQCARRTICDLAELASRRLPKWGQQAVLFYLNAFSETNEYYGVAISGLTLKNCKAAFDDCDVERFFGRLQGNVTEAIKATVGPVGAAFADLVEVASSTMRSMVGDQVEQPESRRPQPADSPRARVSSSMKTIEEEEEEDNEEMEQMRGPMNEGRRPSSAAHARPLPMMAASGAMHRLPAAAQPAHHFPRH